MISREDYEVMKLNGIPKKVARIHGRYLEYYEKLVYSDFAFGYICYCEKYPLIWMFWWFKYRIGKSIEIIDTGLDYILQVWGILPASPANQMLPGITKRIKNQIYRNAKGYGNYQRYK